LKRWVWGGPDVRAADPGGRGVERARPGWGGDGVPEGLGLVVQLGGEGLPGVVDAAAGHERRSDGLGPDASGVVEHVGVVTLHVAGGFLERREGGVVVGEVAGRRLLGDPVVLHRPVAGQAGGELHLPGRVGGHEFGELQRVLQLLPGDVVRDAPEAAALVAGGRSGFTLPGQRSDCGHVAGRDLPGLVEEVVAPPHGARAHHELRADRGGVGVEDAEGGHRVALGEGGEQVFGSDALLVVEVDVHIRLADAVVGGASAGPEVPVGGVGVAEEPADLAGVLGGDLHGEIGVTLPGGGQGVTVLGEEGLVVPEHVGRGVVAEAEDLAVDVARCDDGRVIALDDVGHRLGEVGRVVDLRAARPGDVVVGGEEDGVRPALARLVELGELLLQGLAAHGAVDLHVLEVHIGVGGLERLRRGHPGRVDPDRDGAAGVGLLDLGRGSVSAGAAGGEGHHGGGDAEGRREPGEALFTNK
jgi:hypothetical protein